MNNVVGIISILFGYALVSTSLGADGPSLSTQIQTNYFPNGKMQSTGRMEAGKKEGVWLEYDETGEKFRELTFEHDVLHGPFQVWYPNGKRAQGEFRQDKVNGTLRLWYRNGQLEYETEIKDNLGHGKHAGWHPNGRKKIQGSNSEGNRIGRWIEWDEEGKVLADGTYDNSGKPLNGIVRVRDPKTNNYSTLARYKNGVAVNSSKNSVEQTL